MVEGIFHSGYYLYFSVIIIIIIIKRIVYIIYYIIIVIQKERRGRKGGEGEASFRDTRRNRVGEGGTREEGGVCSIAFLVLISVELSSISHSSPPPSLSHLLSTHPTLLHIPFQPLFPPLPPL